MLKLKKFILKNFNFVFHKKAIDIYAVDTEYILVSIYILVFILVYNILFCFMFYVLCHLSLKKGIEIY